MKNVMLVILMLTAAVVASGEEPLYKTPLNYDNNGQIYFEIIKELPGFNKSEIYLRVNSALANMYKSSKTVIDLNDKESGKIIAKGIWVYTASDGIVTVDCNLGHMLQIQMKDEKIKIVLKNLDLEFTQGSIPIETYIADEKLYKRNGKPRKMMKSHKEGVLKSWITIYETILDSMKNEDDW